MTCAKCGGRGWYEARGEQETGWHREKCDCGLSPATQLLPCPFCGGKADMDGNTSDGYWVECQACGVETAMMFTENHAGIIWNQRTLPSAAADIKSDREHQLLDALAVAILGAQYIDRHRQDTHVRLPEQFVKWANERMGYDYDPACQAPVKWAIEDKRTIPSATSDSKDAARYQWLRDCGAKKAPVSLWQSVDDGSWAGGTGLKQKEELDAAIDAALTASTSTRLEPTDNDRLNQLSGPGIRKT